MRKLIFLILVLSILSFHTATFADTALKKLGRGLANIAISPAEIAYRMGEADDESGPLAAFSWGILDGVYRMGMRAVVGVYEVVTFLIPIPREYKPIIDDPEFFFEKGLF